MNTHQKKYALERISNLSKEKINSANEKYKIKEVRLGDSRRVDLIYEKKVKLLPREKICDTYTDLADAYDFSKYEVEGGYKPERDEIVKIILDKAQKAKDQIMLGDCEEALRLITELEALKI